MKKTLLSTEDKTKNEFIPNEKCSMVEKTPLSKLQQRIRHKTINKLMSSGIKADCLREMLDATNKKTENRFLANREFRRMEKPLLSKLQLRIMREKINQKLGERQSKKLKKELEKEYGPKHGILPSEGLKLRIKRIQ
ncbi:hypothetical protein AVEN_196607-1 [Araneus ventricosus]|uniref:Uncharacterized protein n=1 Tax=Araneus ventricosus TaxID=182803 RepID=A0A4Y2GPQ8_ARAVE|nr:hypothetical protein AVEN_196607-1 [Araneus ventricosus]